MIWGAPALLVLFSLNGWLLGMQNAIAALIIGVVINLINIGLSVYFVMYLDMNVRGVALASVISQYLGVMLAIYIIVRELKKHPGDWLLPDILNRQKIKKFLSLNHDIFIRTICLIFVFAFFTREGARYGDLVLAANAILIKFYLLMALALDGFNHAAEAMVGKAVGARNKNLFKQSVSLALKWSLVFSLVFTLFYWLSGDMLINMLTNIIPVRQEARIYLPWMVLLPVVSIWCFLLDGIFIGATRGPEMRNAMLICTFGFFLPLWYLFQPYGNHGLWLAFTVFILMRGVVLGVYYFHIQRKAGFI
jgi:MATE family multidrug resistance protein